MKRGELRHDLYTITSLTDHAVMTPKYQGKTLVGGDRRSTGIIRKTCEAVNIGTQELYVRNDESLCTGAVLIVAGFSDFGKWELCSDSHYNPEKPI